MENMFCQFLPSFTLRLSPNAQQLQKPLECIVHLQVLYNEKEVLKEDFSYDPKICLRAKG